MVEDTHKKVYDAYRQLQSESYEFITRSVVMHNWLRNAYEYFRAMPETTAEDLYGRWRPAFDEVYGHLFMAFLRPFRNAIMPFADTFQSQLEVFWPRGAAEGWQNFMDMAGEWQARLMSGMAGLAGNGSQPGQEPGVGYGTRDAAPPGVAGLMPASIMAQAADGEASAYFEALQHYFQQIGDSQFLFPKSYFLNLQKIVAGYPRAYAVVRKYEWMFRNTWEKSLRRFVSELKNFSQPVTEYKQFFDAFLKVFAEEYDQFLRSPELISTQNTFVELTAESVLAWRKLMEAQAEMFPIFPFAKGSEVEALEERVHGYKKRIDMLERRLRQLEEQAQSAFVPCPASVPFRAEQ